MTGVSPAIKPGLPAQAVVLANRSTYLNTEFLLQSGARFLNRSAPGKESGGLRCSQPHHVLSDLLEVFRPVAFIGPFWKL